MRRTLLASPASLLAAALASACSHAAPPSTQAPAPARTTTVASTTTSVTASSNVSSARARERPAMLPCPWPTSQQSAGDAPATAPTGVVEPPRVRIPDCAPPGWTPPAQLKEFAPPPLPADRPKPIVDDYLKYVVTAPPPEIVARFKLDTTFYKKYADANGYPILASAKVPDAALAIVRDQVNFMLGSRPDVRDTMIAHGGRVVVQAETEYTVDIPEQRGWTVPKYLDPRLTPGERATYYQPGGLGSMTAAGYWNPRARGMGGTLTTCAEENVLGYWRTKYWGTNICVHEFSHAIMGAGIGNADPAWFQAIVDAYKHAVASCLRTANGYSGNTFNEYWAGGVEWYVGNGGRDRAGLKAEDPRLYDVVSRLIPESKRVPATANVANRTRDEMERWVREHNPEWWQREQAREQARQAADSARRAAMNRPAGAGAPPQQPCVPKSAAPEQQDDAASPPPIDAQTPELLLHPDDALWHAQAPDTYDAVFDTSRGRFVIEVRREWAPNGADRFYNLVRNGFYDGGRFHRVLKNYIAQWGLNGDPAVNRAWKTAYFRDDPVKLGNVRGTIGFAMTGPDMRAVQVYVNTNDNARNDAQGFAAFGRVRDGMDVVDSLYSGYGASSGDGLRSGKQGPVADGGEAYMARAFPKLDRIQKAWIREVKR